MSTQKINSHFLSIFPSLFLVLILLTSMAVYPIPVKAAGSITVTTNADNTTSDSLCSFREAITNANDDAMTYADCLVAGSGNDTILFANGITSITLGSTLPNIADLNGTTIDGGGDVTINGNDVYRIFIVDPGAALTLNNLTVTNGACTSCSGGGIYSSGGSVVITNSSVLNSQQGIYVYEGTVTISDSTFSGNYSTYGGAVSISGAASALTVSNSLFSGNSAPGGGGSAIYGGGTTTITNSTFINNTGGGNGSGAVFIDSTGSATITKSTFSNNSGARGAGVYNNSSTVNIANSTFSGNLSPDHGGGVLNSGGTMTITNSTFSGNSAATSGGDIYQHSPSAVLSLYNNILANSSGGGNCAIDNGTVSGTNNLIEDALTACGFTNNVDGNITGVDPKLGALFGSPAYFPLQPASPAKDKGEDARCTAAPVDNASQNGIPRPQGLHCDIGSYESTVTAAFRSVGAYDGWILESFETSGLGGTMNSTATLFNLGDDNVDRQYRAVLHFNTTSLPDDAVITRVTLKIRKQGVVGTNPFTILGRLKADMRKPFFGSAIGLATGDFQAPAGRAAVAAFRTTPVNNWYMAVLNATGKANLNKVGTTQFRLYFAKDDNNDNGADYMKFFSGNHATASVRPTLIIEYYVP